MHVYLGDPPVKDYKWFIHRNQIKYFTVMVKDIGVTHNIWGKRVSALEGNTTRKKKIHVAGNLVQVPKYLVRLHKDIYLTADMFFVNSIRFFLTLIRKIYFL